jgi:glyoxylase-like metal-dependent hydrolase (beta-lactamase superfamily II)
MGLGAGLVRLAAPFGFFFAPGFAARRFAAIGGRSLGGNKKVALQANLCTRRPFPPRGIRMEVVKGVHKFDTYANTYLVAGQRLVLVDATKDPEAKGVFAGLEKARVKPTDITTIVVTHTHPDHVTGLAALKEKTRAKIVAHETEAPFITRQTTYPGPPGPQKHTAVPVDRTVKDGESFDGFTVIHTPGHTPGHISLLDRERSLLIAGDAVCTGDNHGPIDTKLGVGTMDDAYNIDPKQHRQSIKKLATFEFANLVVGPGPPVLGGASRKLKEYARKL